MSEGNRAFLYGESVFTTMRMVEGVLKDWDLHFERLRKGVDFLYGPFKDTVSWVAIFKNELEVKMQNLEGNRVVRLTVYREQARGLVKANPVSVFDLKIHVSATSFETPQAENKMYKLRSCPVNKRPYWWPDFLKCGNYLETILTQKMYMQPGDDDILFLSPLDTLLETSIANIFIVINNKLYTAPTGPNVLEGITRKKVITAAKDYFNQFEEADIGLDQAFRAEAVFGTNSVKGLFLVDQIDGREITYTKQFIENFEHLKNRVSL